ncbi:MAG: EAL domain-containing protein [Xenococcaceae cyanobacterium]
MILGGNNLELVNTMITLAEKIQLKVIAEGVETMEQVTILENLNCSYGQGYLFSKPINTESVEVLLDTMEQVSKWQL